MHFPKIRNRNFKHFPKIRNRKFLASFENFLQNILKNTPTQKYEISLISKSRDGEHGGLPWVNGYVPFGNRENYCSNIENIIFTGITK